MIRWKMGPPEWIFFLGYFLSVRALQNDEYYDGYYAKPPAIAKSAENRLMSTLLQDYGNPFVRPVLNSTHAVHVNFSISVDYIVDLDERNQVLTTFLGKSHQWRDEALIWNPADYDGVTRIVLPCWDIWTPNVILISNMEEEVSPDKTMKTRDVAVTYDGTCTWSTSAIYRSTCLVNMEEFPFDTQTCYWVFGTWMYDVSQVELFPMNSSSWYGVNIFNMKNNIAWTLADAYMEKMVVTGSNSTANSVQEFRDLLVTLVLIRNSNYFAKFTLLPVLLLSGLVLLVFWIPPSRPDRIGLCTSIFGSFLLLLLLVVQLSPPSGGVKLGAFCCVQMIKIFVATILSIIVVNLSQRTDPVPPWITRIYFWQQSNRSTNSNSTCACCLNPRMSDRHYHVTSGVQSYHTDAPLPEVQARDKPKQNNNQNWRTVAKGLDRCFFIAYLIVSIVCFYRYFPRPQNIDHLTRHHFDDEG